MRHLKTSLAVLGAAAILILAGNSISIAATGHGFILGQGNSASKITKLTRTTSGPALNINTKSTGSAPFTVNGHGKVTNLNADTVDGYDSSAMRNLAYVFTAPVVSASDLVAFVIPVGPGTYHYDYSAYLHGAESGPNAFCEIQRTHSGVVSQIYSVAQVAPGIQSPGLGGSGVVTKNVGDTLYLECGASNAFTTITGLPLQVVMSPTTIAGNGALASPRISARNSAH